MNEYLVRFHYEYEGMSGFDHKDSTEYLVEARSEESALKKANKLLLKEVDPQSILSTQCIKLQKEEKEENKS